MGETDTISRQDAIDALSQYPFEKVVNCISIIEEFPSAQPEIIRCRDCIAYQEGIDIDGKPFTRCNGINGSVRTYGHTLPDWYCADAERRTDE
jgi:hypothetical protein